MRSFFIRRSSFFLLLGGIVIVSATLVYLLIGNRVAQQPTGSPRSTSPKTLYTPLAELTPSPPPKLCDSTQRNFQTGIAFPQWNPAGYSENDTQWLTELPNMRTRTNACWVEIPILFGQSSLSSTMVTQGPSTPSIASFNYGVHFAHALGFHIFVTPLLQVNGSQPWAGAIQFQTYAQEQQWFENYWQGLKPYVVAAAQAGVEQFAVGTEYEWLQENAPDALWNTLITEIRGVFPGTITYDMNWTSLQKSPRAWMHNANLKMIGVSAYLPLINTPKRVDPKQIFNLWKETVKRALDNFAIKLGEPIFISEIGYRNNADALYNPWVPTSSAAADAEEQAAACDAALANIISDQHILGSFFWGWDDVGGFNLRGSQATNVIWARYTALEA